MVVQEKALFPHLTVKKNILFGIESNSNKNEIVSEAKSEIFEKKYMSNTDSARENKVFGSPSFIVENEIFWGDDRMEDAIKWSKM